ncbi:hypothetical protein PoB_005733200 [Plakobranchus ocellatus]|uniref:Uncharacterized protein n=1 Tax=Plakobranchus ocellatus TaxID=259542 RepID=A0AAV4CHP5_9GAST|nr:hypothetical protein PoB_005733200 [Plakobranchus ocellatus]
MIYFLEKHEETVCIGGRITTNLRFADGIDGIAGNGQELANLALYGVGEEEAEKGEDGKHNIREWTGIVVRELLRRVESWGEGRKLFAINHPGASQRMDIYRIDDDDDDDDDDFDDELILSYCLPRSHIIFS